MSSLIIVLLKEPDLILEADPLHDILKLWNRYGLSSAMILNHVNLQDVARYGASALNRQFECDDGTGLISLLYEVPQRQTDAEASISGNDGDSHRLLLSIADSRIQIEALLNATEALLQARTCSEEDLIFVFPLAHVRKVGSPDQAGA